MRPGEEEGGGWPACFAAPTAASAIPMNGGRGGERLIFGMNLCTFSGEGERGGEQSLFFESSFCETYCSMHIHNGAGRICKEFGSCSLAVKREEGMDAGHTDAGFTAYVVL